MLRGEQHGIRFGLSRAAVFAKICGMAEQNKIVAEYVTEVARLAKTGLMAECDFRPVTSLFLL